ncbi:hypothetical protein J3F84DRAFT_161459 [Trichoderma pleuroticola]
MPKAFVIRTVGGNVRPHLNDLLYLEALLNNELRDIIVIHHEDCGTTRISEEMIKTISRPKPQILTVKSTTSNFTCMTDRISRIACEPN